MKLIPVAVLVFVAGLFLAAAGAQQAAPDAHQHSTPDAHQHSAPTHKPGEAMDHDKMMADMKAVDARLEGLARTMKSASGNDRIPAMQALLSELVQNQLAMHRHMAMMHDHMMSQMSHK